MPPDEQTAEPQVRLKASSSASKTGVSQSENQILQSWQTPSNKDPASWDFFYSIFNLPQNADVKVQEQKNGINLCCPDRELRNQKFECFWSRSLWKPVAQLKIDIPRAWYR